MILDSNIIIYSNQPGYELLLLWLQKPENTFEVSAISKIEVLGFPKLSIQDKADFDVFFANTTTLPITSELIDEAIRLRQQRKRSLGDAVIAATALVHHLPVLTNNVDDFLTIDRLTVIPLGTILAGKTT